MLIYLITNLKTGKKYVGQTRRTLGARWKEHLKSAGQPSRWCQSRYLYASMNHHGLESFMIQRIDRASSQLELDDLEELWITKLGSNQRRRGYNISFGGSSPIASDETRAKLSASLKGKPAWNKGISPSPESVAKMVDSQRKRTGPRLSETGRQRIRESKLGENNPNFGGKAMTPESIAKRVAKVKGKPSWIRGKHHKDESKAKMRGPRPQAWGPRPQIAGPNHHNFSHRASEAVVKQLRSIGMPLAEISQRLDCCVETVRKRLGGWPENLLQEQACFLT